MAEDESTGTVDRDAQFPTDWNEWWKVWTAWKRHHDLLPTSYRFPGKNLLADEVLGTFSINGRNVELSEVTFPNLSERDENGRLRDHRVRMVGITFGIGVDQAGAVATTFAELERELGLDSGEETSAVEA